jgi:hypothetical protein
VYPGGWPTFQIAGERIFNSVRRSPSLELFRILGRSNGGSCSGLTARARASPPHGSEVKGSGQECPAYTNLLVDYERILLLGCGLRLSPGRWPGCFFGCFFGSFLLEQS